MLTLFGFEGIRLAIGRSMLDIGRTITESMTCDANQKPDGQRTASMFLENCTEDIEKEPLSCK